MAVTDLVEQAAKSGVTFVLKGNRVGLPGDHPAVKEGAPRPRGPRAAVLREVQERIAGLHRIWIIRPPLRTAFTVACPQGATEAEVRLVWTGADVEPLE